MNMSKRSPGPRRATASLVLCLAAVAAVCPASAQQPAEPEAKPSLLGRTSKPTYGGELEDQQKQAEAQDAAIAAQAAERVARFGALPTDTPAEVRQEYQRLVDAVRTAMAAVRREYTRHQTSEDLDPDGPRQWYNAVEKANAAFAAWLGRAAELYASDPALYQDLGLTMMEIVRVEAALDRTENLLAPARAILEHSPERLDPPLLLQIGYIGYTQGDFDLAKAAWERYKQDGVLPADYAGFYESIDEVRQKWQRELEQREADKGRDNPIVVLQTNKGMLTVELFEDQAPNAVANFLYLASHGYFERMRIFRVIPKYCIQTGCINGDGTGNAGYQIAGENERPDRRDVFRGSLAFALGVDPMTGQPMPDTASSQFIIATTPLPGLNDAMTVFGRVIDGQFLLGTFNKVDLSDEEQQKDPSIRADVLIDTEIVEKRDHQYRPEVARGELPF